MTPPPAVRRAAMRPLSLVLPALLAGCASGARRAPAGAAADVHALAAAGRLTPVGRAAAPLDDPACRGVRLDERTGDEGLAWLGTVASPSAELVVRVRGQDVVQRSFVGVAFAGADDGGYEAVYLRPFNFRAADAARRARAVQYVAHPAYPWDRLRRERPGAFEAPAPGAPDPGAWHELRVRVGPDSVHAALDGAPALAVARLRPRAGGRVGLFVGAGSGGDFCRFHAAPA